ncbi:hypothetical protein HPP92_014302 [Vanilla planifolia]|uniref:ATG8-interacting protein 1 n=1 Tax=Vanilla planifolia TaxID=51239 RepID=A0A835QP73_VANPL|nr:hypothetical protein HPP92_014302 [Vanilla planifolia]
MADETKDVTETNSKGADWEVVSLTASTYAAAPGPKEFDAPVLCADEKQKTAEQESSDAMLMSKHFIVPPHDQEILPSEYGPENYKQQSIYVEEFIEPFKLDKEKYKIDSKNDLHESQLFEDVKSLSSSTDLGDVKIEEGPTVLEIQKALIGTADSGSLHAEAGMSQSVTHYEAFDLTELRPISEDKLDDPIGAEDSCKPTKESNYEKSEKSPEAWWKKRAMSVYNNAKGTNTFWSIFIAVALAGFVIIGQRWRKEKSQLQFKWKFGGRNEKVSEMAGKISQFKNVIASGHRYGSSMRDGLHQPF